MLRLWHISGIKILLTAALEPVLNRLYSYQKNAFVFLKKSNFKGDLNPAMII
jgi:hypothetical protein